MVCHVRFCIHNLVVCLLSFTCGSSLVSLHNLQKRDLAVCENMPLSFARHWQVIGQKGRQLWIGRHYLRILGPVDDVFGKAAGGVRIRWYNLKCSDDMVQMKAVISESRSRGNGEYMCIRLKHQNNRILGFVTREYNKIAKKYTMDCEYWGDGNTRHAYMFHLTDNPTWVDLLAKSDAVVQASKDMTMKICGDIPEGFHGDWKLAGTDKVVEFRKKYYRAYGAHGNDPFWRTNTEISYYALVCNPRRIVMRAYMWELPPGSKSQLQCLTLDLDGEYDLTGHAVNMVASKLPGTDAPPEIDCDHGVGNDYTRYPLHLTRQLDEVLAPKPIHNLAEHDQVEETEDFEQEHEISDEHHDSSDHGHETVHESGIHGSLDGVHVDTEISDGTQHELPLVDTGHSDNHEGHDPAQIRAPDHHSLEESENHHQVHDAIVGDTPEPATLEPPTKPSDIPHQPLQRPENARGPWYGRPAYPSYINPYNAYPYYQPMRPPPYWLGKRTHKSEGGNTEVRKREYMSDADYYDAMEQSSINKQLLTAVNKQNDILEKTFNKLTELLDKDEITTTEDWEYIKPYLKQDFSEDEDKRHDKRDENHIFDYYADD